MLYYILAYFILGILWGIATNKVIENKGYQENWFWWGFFFNFIGFVVALTKPENRTYSNNYDDVGPQEPAHTTYDQSTLSEEERKSILKGGRLGMLLLS